MNVILVSRQGILDTPILVKDDTTAQAEFDNVAHSLVGDEGLKEIDLHSDSQIDDLNSLLEGTGYEVWWFCDVPVNTYVNPKE